MGILTYKHGNLWNFEDLCDFNIYIKDVNDTDFFGHSVDGVNIARELFEGNRDSDGDDYIMYLLKNMGFDNIQTKENIAMAIKDDMIDLNTDVVLRNNDNNRIRLIIQHTDKIMDDQIVQRMIAVHQTNEDDEETIAVSVINNLPIFYKSKITNDLQYAIIENIHPKIDTIVYKFDPFVDGRERQNIANRDTRKCILQCFKLLMS